MSEIFSTKAKTLIARRKEFDNYFLAFFAPWRFFSGKKQSLLL